MLSLLLLCALHICSNDSLPLPILGDAVLEWAAVPDTDLQTYEVWRSDALAPCLIVNPDLTSIRVDGTSCLLPNDTALLRVRACDLAGQCGGFSNEVEILPFTCINSPCEDLCFADAPYRLPEDRRCQL